MERWAGRVAVVTGASAGIGAALVKLLSAHGMKVVGCARRLDKIEELAKARDNVFPYKLDLRNDDEVKKMFSWIEADPRLGRVDVCVANAGLSAPGTLLESSVEDWRLMTDVNVIALCLCVQLSLKSMIKHGVKDGQLVLINSMSGHRVPSARFYPASKFAVNALLEGFRQEIRELGDNHIRIAQVSPGLVETEFAHSMYAGQPGQADKLYSSIKCLEAEDVADQVRHILAMPKHVQIHDILMRPTEQKN